MEAAAYAPLGVVGEVLGVVAPPGAVVVPEVVERVLRGPDRKNRLVGGGYRCAPRNG